MVETVLFVDGTNIILYNSNIRIKICFCIVIRMFSVDCINEFEKSFHIDAEYCNSCWCSNFVFTCNN